MIQYPFSIESSDKLLEYIKNPQPIANSVVMNVANFDWQNLDRNAPRLGFVNILHFIYEANAHIEWIYQPTSSQNTQKLYLDKIGELSIEFQQVPSYDQNGSSLYHHYLRQQNRNAFPAQQDVLTTILLKEKCDASRAIQADKLISRPIIFSDTKKTELLDMFLPNSKVIQSHPYHLRKL